MKWNVYIIKNWDIWSKIIVIELQWRLLQKTQMNITTSNQKLCVVTLWVDESFDQVWYMDFGFIQHMSHYKNSLVTYEKWEQRQFLI
jgi:hypothetical protein